MHNIEKVCTSIIINNSALFLHLCFQLLGKRLLPMGVDHEGRERQVSPQNLEREDCPPDFVMLQNFKHQITCITM